MAAISSKLLISADSDRQDDVLLVALENYRRGRLFSPNRVDFIDGSILGRGGVRAGGGRAQTPRGRG